MSDKRFELAYEQGNWWAVRDGNITLWKEEVVDLLNALQDENEQLRKIGVMYQGHNPCETCTYCLENKVCCAEPVLICDDAKKNFIQGLCKKHKQFQKSIRRYDDE